MEFLVQYAIEGIEEFTNKMVNSCWIINATNESDSRIACIRYYRIWENQTITLHRMATRMFGRIYR